MTTEKTKVETEAEAAGFHGGQGRTAEDVYANGSVALVACALIAAALLTGLVWLLWDICKAISKGG